MSAKAAISKEVFIPHDEKMLAAVQVRRRTKKKIPFLATGGQGDYMTFICLSVTNKKPAHVSLTKVKQFQGSSAFVKRHSGRLISCGRSTASDPNKELSRSSTWCLKMRLTSGALVHLEKKCTFIQILHHTCQRYCSARKPEFINCQSKLMGGNSILHSAADSVTSAVQKASQALNERGERLGRAEDRTADMMNSAEQFAVTAHKVRSRSDSLRSPSTIRGHFAVLTAQSEQTWPSSPCSTLVIIGAAETSNIGLNTLSAVCSLCSWEIMFSFLLLHLFFCSFRLRPSLRLSPLCTSCLHG
ncbi:unnamed protein product [Tetraodon nigroviridis]|uniref:Chromosome 10 SCAF15019, whole genome shotgun sequence n=1 Tax=Tetraodon nigroviridis TaxID=99883 RepID=Q4RMJ6_TETNG|nr:unnamed protein product [Tetraodon nigroviridis]